MDEAPGANTGRRQLGPPSMIQFHYPVTTRMGLKPVQKHLISSLVSPTLPLSPCVSSWGEIVAVSKILVSEATGNDIRIVPISDNKRKRGALLYDNFERTGDIIVQIQSSRINPLRKDLSRNMVQSILQYWFVHQSPRTFDRNRGTFDHGFV